jgi:hypothetical protein
MYKSRSTGDSIVITKTYYILYPFHLLFCKILMWLSYYPPKYFFLEVQMNAQRDRRVRAL